MLQLERLVVSFRFCRATSRNSVWILRASSLERSTRKRQPSTFKSMAETDQRGDDRVGVIDMIAHDPKTDEAVLVMNETERWNDSDERLLHLQERFNAYVSFLLDGEFAGWDPKLAQRRARIEVRCAHMPDARALELLGQIHDQLAHQDIVVQVIVKNAEARMTNDEGMTK